MALIDGSVRARISTGLQYERRLRNVLRIPHAQQELREIQTLEGLMEWEPYPTPTYEISGAVVPFVERVNAIVQSSTLRWVKRAFNLDAAHLIGGRSVVAAMFRQSTLRPIGDDAFLIAAVARNVNLIKTIHPRMLSDLRSITELVMRNRPFDRAVHREILRRLFRSTGYNLRRLTRDQNSKLTQQLAERRQRELGITAYIWRTAQDERVRPTHRANNGRRFDWGNPPAATGHPGVAVQCRCTSRPLAQTSPFLQSARPNVPPLSNPLLTLTASTASEWKQVFARKSLDELASQIALLSATAPLDALLERARAGDPVARRRLEDELAKRMEAIS